MVSKKSLEKFLRYTKILGLICLEGSCTKKRLDKEMLGINEKSFYRAMASWVDDGLVSNKKVPNRGNSKMAWASTEITDEFISKVKAELGFLFD